MSHGRATELAAALDESGYTSIVLDRLAKQACQIVGADGSCLVVRDRSELESGIAVAACGVDEELVGSRVKAGAELARRSSGSVPSMSAGRFNRRKVTAPVRWSGEVLGALRAETEEGPPFGPQELSVIATLAETAGSALAHGERRGELLSTLRDRLAAFMAAIDARDGYTGCHSEEVAGLCTRLGECLRLERADMLELELAALLHDVGKLSLREALLKKPSALESDEWEAVRQHPVWGAELIAGIPGLAPVATIVRFHHERWDGGGYPAGLREERIPLASRIIAVCDAYHAMTSDRPYRGRMGENDAIAELRAGSGGQFDPALVEAFVADLDPVVAAAAV